jgi:hypothetical protein
MLLLVVASAAVAICNIGEPALRISSTYSGNPPALILEWSSATGTEDFVRTSYDLHDWNLLPLMVEGSGATIAKEIGSPTTPVFFQILRQAQATLPWVTTAATTTLAEYQLLYSNAIQAPTSYHIYLPPVYANL